MFHGAGSFMVQAVDGFHGLERNGSAVCFVWVDGFHGLGSWNYESGHEQDW